MDAFDLYNDFASRVNTWQGGNFSFSQDFVRNLNAVYFDLWERETKNARKSQTSKDNCRLFHVSKNILISNSLYSNYSIIDLNNDKLKDYGRFSSARLLFIKNKSEDKKEDTNIPDFNIDKGKCITKGNVEYKPIKKEQLKSAEIYEIAVEEVNDDQWAACLSHLKKYPTLQHPKMVQINNGFQIAPKGISVIVFSYYKKPQPIVVKVEYTAGDDQYGNGDEVVYTPTPQSKILFPDAGNLRNDFIWRLAEIYGYANRENFLSLFGNEKLKQIDV